MEQGIERVTLTMPEVATYLGIGRTAAYNLAHSEGFPSFRIGRRLLVCKAALDAWIAERQGNKKGRSLQAEQSRERPRTKRQSAVCKNMIAQSRRRGKG